MEAGSEYGVIRIYQYENEETWDSATIEAGLAEAVDEICNTDPLGVYAVDYMTHDCTQIATYYEIHLYITYTRTPEEIAAIIRVGGMNGIRSPMTAAIVEAEPKIALRVSNYAPTNYDLLARRCYRGAPSQIVCLPEITSSIYPVSGVQRIVELQFQYPIRTHRWMRGAQSWTRRSASWQANIRRPSMPPRCALCAISSEHKPWERPGRKTRCSMI